MAYARVLTVCRVIQSIPRASLPFFDAPYVDIGCTAENLDPRGPAAVGVGVGEDLPDLSGDPSASLTSFECG